MIKTQCLSCEVSFEIEQSPEIGHKICCPHCMENLEVVWLFPLTLDVILDTAAGDHIQTISMVNS